MKKNTNIYIIGCGNELAGDDGVGIAVVRRLMAETKLPGGVQIIEAGIPGLSLVELMLGANKVILVDSFLGGTAPGTVRCFGEEELPPPSYNAGQSHGIGLREALSFARGVMPGNFPEQVVVVGVEIERPLRWVQGLSPAVEAAVEQAMDMVVTQLNTWR
ncbi:hydrogenase maturation protease [Desulfallas thermosapovorans]|uniref:Hydrogenase maturation protease n=1 Tax=Desulfallas thermosapovorans DSM 6562 TaxID=1121431 RepID=A0A5S4ZTA2_9FIRM|nr:hydrogenase maturation protease [Desulfallas thermosapovorans]TYO95401.1 hydrogenase maturation protease [Desulfallas thermosapovorans DSM 6562]